MIYFVIDDPSKVDCLQTGLDKLYLWSAKCQLNIAANTTQNLITN